MTGWDRLRDLALDVTTVRIQERRLPVSEQWTRRTRELTLSGPGPAGVELVGAGEDVSWVEVSEDEILALYPEDLLVFRGTFGEWCDRLTARERTPFYATLAAARQSDPDYLRWGLESAAMELALRQNQTTLSTCLGRAPQIMRFGLSMGLGDPPTVDTLLAWRAHGDYRFKLDAASSWSAELLTELCALDCVDVVDLKAYYHDTPVDQPIDPALYERVVQGLPQTVVEDAFPNEETLSILQPAQARLSWDAPIHAVDDLDTVVPPTLHPVRWLNIKPSRFGSWERLLGIYAWADAHQVQTYGGGQFELGIGREHAQALAMLFHPDGPNDLAPSLFHSASPAPDLPVDRWRPQDLTETAWLAAPDTRG